MSESFRPGDQMFVFKELEGKNCEPKKMISVSDFDIKPLDFDELSQVRLHESIKIPLEVWNARITETDIAGADTRMYAHFKTVLTSPFSSRAIGLVRGGWLPSALAAHRNRTVILVDRNIVTEIVGRFEDGNKKGREPDFLDIFSDLPVRINPLLYVIEGNTRTTPGPVLVLEQLGEVTAKLKKALPKADLQIGADHLKAILGLIESSRADLDRDVAFLVRLAPSLRSPVSRKNRGRRWEEALDVAGALGVPRDSLVMLAVLSSIAVPGGRSPAKALLKFKDGYSSADAYNAIADLRSLELLMYVFAVFPNESMQLCTSDKNLALFWTGIRASNFREDAHDVSFDMDPVEGLLPSDAREKWASTITYDTSSFGLPNFPSSGLAT